MTLKNTFTHALAAVLAITLVAAPARALTFTDFLNLAQNSSTAAAAVQSEIHNAKQLVQQINAASDLARSTAGLKNLAGLAGIDQARQLYRSLVEIDGRLSANLEQNGRLVNDLRSQFGASNMSWKDFTASQSRINAERQRLAREQYAAMTLSMEETARKRQQIVEQLSSVDGQTKAMQALGASLDVLIGQNQQVMAQMRADQVIEKDSGADAEAQRIWAENQKALYQKRLREAASQF